MKLKVAALSAMLLAGLSSAVCGTQEFSADVVYLATGDPKAAFGGTEASVHPPSKLYVSKDKMRLETRGRTGTILLVNKGEQTAYALFPQQMEYQPLASGPSEYFRVQDAENACPDWQKATDQKIVCEKVGPEVVEGRQTVKYQNKGGADAATWAVWIDSALKYVVKWEGGKTGAELRNIHEGVQAAELFAVPSSYQALKPRKASSKGFPQRKP
jgi:hypothetical protein